MHKRITDAFRREADGSWTCVAAASFDQSSGRIQFTANAVFGPEDTFMGTKVAKWLDGLTSRMRDARSVLKRLAQGILSVPFSFVAPVAFAETFIGEVVKVQDGDTLTVLVNKIQIRVRLDAIDAPERSQAFGQRSRQSLADICTGKAASVVERGKDRYGRTIGRVRCASVDANSEQVRRGMAWVFVRYAPKNSPLYGLENEARKFQRGLWKESQPVPPWEWRQNSGTNYRGSGPP